jgi:multidrug resistance efflux pump
VRDAEAALVSARSDLAALTEDPTSSEAAAAAAAIEQAQGQLATTQGAVTQQDIAAAQAQLQQAEANLADVLAGPKQEEVRQATAQRDAAAVNLESQRNNLSQIKTAAELDLQNAVVALQSAQTQYSEAYWQWEYARSRDAQPSDIEQGPEPNLSDTGQQRAYNAYKQAELALEQAQKNVEGRQLILEQAQKNEVTGIEAAQKNLEAAQASLDLLVRPADADTVAAAQAQVANAQANIEKLQGGNRAGQLAAAAAAVQAAQANYEKLFDDPTASAVARAEAGVARAEANLEQAKLNREYAEIRAPFAGEIAVRNIDPGDTGPTSTAGGTGALRLVDTSAVYVEVQVTDADIANIELGQAVNITADALPGEQYTGTVSFISPTAAVNQTVTTYLVKVQLDEQDTPLRIGMSVTADFETDAQ